MENQDNLNGSGVDAPETVCATEQEALTVLDDQYVPSSGTEKQHKDILGIPADSDVEQCEKNEENTSSLKKSCVHNNVAIDKKEVVPGLNNCEEQICETVVGNEDTAHESRSEQGSSAGIHQTQSNQWSSAKADSGSGFSTDHLSNANSVHTLSFALTESEKREKSEFSETTCNLALVENVPDLDKSDNDQYSFFSDRNISSEHELEKNGTFQTSGQPDIESKIDKSQGIECQMEPQKSCFTNKQENNKCSSDMCQDSNEVKVELNSKQTETDSGISEDQTCHKQAAEEEAETGSGCLDGIISSIQSITCHQTDADKDTVKISRAELTFMMEQTLIAQTMRRYMQDLLQENKTLNKQNEVLKDTIVLTRKWKGEERENTNILPVISQSTSAQVFRFPEHEGESSPIQTDGDLMSASLQLSSQIGLDGDTSMSREASAAGKAYHPVCGPSSAASAASVPAQGAPTPNIPHHIVFAEASCYSFGPQQNEETGIGSAGMSQEHFKRVVDELEKLKRFVHKITKQAGVHPDAIQQELVNLREKEQRLQEENTQLKIELQNRPDPKTGRLGPGLEEHQLEPMINDLKEKLQGQKKREDTLLKHLTELNAENKRLKLGGIRPLSQPPSSVGLQALPPIPPTSTVYCQTEESCATIEEYAAQLDMMKQQEGSLRTHLAMLKEELKEAQQRGEHLHSQLKAKIDENLHFQGSKQIIEHQVQELKLQLTSLHRENNKLSQAGKALSQEAERYKKICALEVDRSKQLEKMIDDERKRYARDEKELLNQVKMVTKEAHLLKQLIFAMDKARVNGSPLPSECANHLAALQKRSQGNPPAVVAVPPIRAGSSHGSVSGQPSTSRFMQPHNASGIAQAGAVFDRNSDQGRGSGGRGSHSSSCAAPQGAASPYGSLSSAVSRPSGQQYPGQAGS